MLGIGPDSPPLLPEGAVWETGGHPYPTAGSIAGARRARDIAAKLGMPGLLASLTLPADEWALFRDGPDWQLDAGEEHARLRDGRGLDYLRALLAAPGQEITALDLVAGGPGLSAAGAGPVLDAAARAAYRRRLELLQGELDAADAAGDVLRGQRAATERDEVLRELRRATGLGGRPRDVSGNDERARVNVTRTLRASIDGITAAAPRAGAHLSGSIHTGRACRYQPGPGGPARWRV